MKGHACRDEAPQASISQGQRRDGSGLPRRRKRLRVNPLDTTIDGLSGFESALIVWLLLDSRSVFSAKLKACVPWCDCGRQ